MRIRTFFFLLLLILPSAGTSGAWLQEKGTSFTSTAFTANWFRDTATQSYLEFGIRKKLTIGADVNVYRLRTGLQTGDATVFLRRPIRSTTASYKLAYEIGVGATWDTLAIAPHLKTGLSWGRGFKMVERSGWLSVDASIKWDLGQQEHSAKLDSTAGFNFTNKLAGMMQVNLMHVQGQTHTTFAPSIIFAPPQRKSRYVVGLLMDPKTPEDTAIKFSIWRSFKKKNQ